MALLNYQSKVPSETVRAYEEVERARQALLSGEASHRTLSYARFLVAVESDAARSGFRADDREVARQWPCLRAVIENGET